MEQEETEEGDEESGNLGPPDTRRVVLPLVATNGDAPWWGAGGGALCAGLVPRPPRQATGATPRDAPKVCRAVGIVAGHRCAGGAPLCADCVRERGRRRWPRGKWWSRGPSGAGPRATAQPERIVGGSSIGPRMLELVERGLIHRPPHVRVGGKETVTDWSVPRSRAA